MKKPETKKLEVDKIYTSDAYGNCSSISSPYTPPIHKIKSTETWQGTTTECGNVIVKNGGNLTIKEPQ